MQIYKLFETLKLNEDNSFEYKIYGVYSVGGKSDAIIQGDYEINDFHQLLLNPKDIVIHEIINKDDTIETTNIALEKKSVINDSLLKYYFPISFYSSKYVIYKNWNRVYLLSEDRKLHFAVSINSGWENDSMSHNSILNKSLPNVNIEKDTVLPEIIKDLVFNEPLEVEIIDIIKNENHDTTEVVGAYHYKINKGNMEGVFVGCQFYRIENGCSLEIIETEEFNSIGVCSPTTDYWCKCIIGDKLSTFIGDK